MTGHQVFEFGQLTREAEHSKPPARPSEPPSECPRCHSTNTKFCYYNNYNKLQPRHFCKSCKRHWTKGGTLRSIPAGRSRTNKRPAAATEAPPEPQPPRKNKIQKLLSFSTDQKNMSNILYQALIQSSSPSTDCINFIVPHGTILESHGTTHAAGLNESAHQNQNYPNTELTFSNYYPNDSAAESTVTTSAAPRWTSSNLGAAADVADLWNWNDQIDSLAGSSDFNLVWDHLKFDF